VAASREFDGDNATKPRTARTLIASLQLSLWVGLSFGAVLMALSRPLLKALIGNDALDPVVFETALKYVRIRALGMPAGTVIGSAQAACMGMQDVKSPLYVLAAAALVNLIGDILLVGNTHTWFGGAAGAAWATVFSQVAAMSLFMKWLLSRPENALETKDEECNAIEAANNILPIKVFKSETVSNLTKSIKSRVSKPVSSEQKADKKPVKNSDSRRSTSQTMKAAITSLEHEVHQAKRKANKKANMAFASATKRSPVFGHLKNLNESMKIKRLASKAKKEEAKKEAASEGFSTRGFLHGRFSPQQLVQLPNREIAKEFVPYIMPITSTSAGRVSSYVAMSHVISSAMGTGAMAAQQVIISMFYCLTPIADSLNLTAQSLLPAIYEKPKGRERAAVLKKTAKEMMQAGVIFGGVLLALVSMIPLVCRLFTADPLVVSQVRSVVPLLAGSFVVHGLICAMEGCMLGQKDLGFLGKSYATYFLGVPYFMLRVKKAALSGASGIGLTSVWTVFMYYQLVRVSMFVGRVWKLGKTVTDEANEIPLLIIDDVGVLSVGQPLNQIDAVLPMLEDLAQRDFNATAGSFA
jgi:Na+-driven multidrug efflux pump